MNIFYFFLVIPHHGIPIQYQAADADQVGYSSHCIWFIQTFHRLDEKSLKILSNPPTSSPLFPNLQVLHCEYTEKTMPLLHLPLPSLSFLKVLYIPHSSQNSLGLFPNFSLILGVFAFICFQVKRLHLPQLTWNPTISTAGRISVLWPVLGSPWTWTLLCTYSGCLCWPRPEWIPPSLERCV